MPAYVDVRLPGVLFRQRRLIVNNEGLTWGRKAVRFDRVTALAGHCIEGRIAGRTASRGCEIWLYSGKKRVHIAFRAGSETALAAYETTREALRTHVESRLVSKLLAAIEAGDVVKVQSLQLSREGLTLRRSLVSWSDVVGVRPRRRTFNPPMGDLMIWTSDGRGGAKPFADVFYDQPNGVLLPALIRACVSRYSTG